MIRERKNRQVDREREKDREMGECGEKTERSGQVKEKERKLAMEIKREPLERVKEKEKQSTG